MHLVMTTHLRGGHDYFRIGMLLSLGSQRVLIVHAFAGGFLLYSNLYFLYYILL